MSNCKIVISILILVIFFEGLIFAEEEFIYDPKGKRDPFIPLVTEDGRILKLETEDKEEKLLVEGIVYSKAGLSYAIVNGEVVRVGDKVQDYNVLKIEENRIIFIKEGQPLVIELKEEEEE